MLIIAKNAKVGFVDEGGCAWHPLAKKKEVCVKQSRKTTKEEEMERKDKKNGNRVKGM